MRGGDGACDEAQDRGVVRHGACRSSGILTIGGKGVLDEVVGADREEVAAARDCGGVERGRRDLDHCPDERIGPAGDDVVARGTRDLTHGVDLVGLADHRNQDPHNSIACDRQECAKLRSDAMGGGERQPDAASAEGARGVGVDQERRRLVAAKIQRSYRGYAVGERGEQGRERSAVALLVRPPGRIQERQFRAQQPDAVRTRRQRCVDLGARAGVGEQSHRTAIARHCRFVSLVEGALRLSAQTLDAPAEPHSGGGREVAQDEAAIGIDRDLLAVGNLQGSRADARHERDPERSSHDRRVRGRATLGEHDAGDLARPGGNLARPQILGKDDRAGRRSDTIAVRELAGAPGDGAQVGGARGQRRVVQIGQRCDVRRRRLCDGAARRLPSGNGRTRGDDERGVVGHHAIGLDDVGVGVVSLRAEARGQRVELDDDEREPTLDARPLLVGISGRRIVAVDAGPGGPERGARRRRVTAKGDLGHDVSWTARSRAATTIATDVAPGS